MRVTKVLVVEDERPQAAALERLLSERGYSVRVASDGKSAIATLSDWEPAVAVLDIGLPDMSGFELAQALRRNPSTRHLPLIALTRCQRPEDYVRGLLAGLDGYLEKPFGAEELVRLVETTVSQARRRSRQRALLSDVGVAPGLELSVAREQILGALLRAIDRRVPCDLVAVWWKDSDRGQLLLVSNTTPPADLAARLGPRLGVPPSELDAAATRIVLVPDERASRLFGATLSGGPVLPLLRGDECLGLLCLDNFRGLEVGDAADEVLADIAPLLSRLLVAGLGLEKPRELEAATRLTELEAALVLASAAEAEAVTERLESALPGLRVGAVESDDIPYLGDEFHLLLVDPAMREGVDTRMFERARGPHRAIAVLDFDREALEEPRRLRGFLLMAVLIAFMDGRRTGCLHVQGHRSGRPGVIVFVDGRIAWASCAGSDASFASLLVARATGSRERLLAAVHTSASSQRPIAEVLQSSGLVDETGFRDALREYLVDVLGEILRIAKPGILYSNLVVPGSHNVSFDVDEITMAVFAA